MEIGKCRALRQSSSSGMHLTKAKTKTFWIILPYLPTLRGGPECGCLLLIEVHVAGLQKHSGAGLSPEPRDLICMDPEQQRSAAPETKATRRASFRRPSQAARRRPIPCPKPNVPPASEGAVLNITKIYSRCLVIPQQILFLCPGERRTWAPG